MKPYIMKNTRLRTVAKTEFEKDFFKFMNNSVCGKTLENIKNHEASFKPRETTYVWNKAKLKRWVSIFEKVNCCRDEENRDQDEEVTLPWTTNIKLNQGANV